MVTIVCTWKLVNVIKDEDKINLIRSENELNTEATTLTQNDLADLNVQMEKDETFKIIMLVCLSVTIFSGILQVVTSLTVLFSCSEVRNTHS